MTRRIDLRNLIICAAVMVGAFLIVNPFVDLSFDDDWSYAFTVQRFLQTGHITYNGWSAPLLITHTWWAALWCKIFGFSFISLRFSTLPLDIGALIFIYLLARRSKLPPTASLCATLTLGLSPLFLPLATSFMTDAPAMFYIFASLYFFVRSAQAITRRSAILWLVAGTIIGIFGGMNRQTAWVVPITILPYLLLLRRKDFAYVASALLAWLLLIADIIASLHWFAQQPNTIIDPSLLHSLRNAIHPPLLIPIIADVAFTTALFAIPCAAPFALDSLRTIWRDRQSWRSGASAVVILLLAIWIGRQPATGMFPWLYNIMTVYGVIGPLEISGGRVFQLPLIPRGAASALALMIVFLLLARLIVSAIDFKRTSHAARELFAGGDGRPMMIIFCAAYYALMVIRAGDNWVFDRYCLPLIACASILLIRDRPLIWVWPLVIIFGIYALAVTQDNFALARARVTAIHRLESAGVPPTQIAAGLEHDFNTQLHADGVINRFGINHPTRPFNPIQGYTPALICKYRIEYPILADTKPSRFGEVDYISWLPPFHRKIFISEYKNPWWLKSLLPPGQVIPANFEFDFEPSGQ